MKERSANPPQRLNGFRPRSEITKQGRPAELHGYRDPSHSQAWLSKEMKPFIPSPREEEGGAGRRAQSTQLLPQQQGLVQGSPERDPRVPIPGGTAGTLGVLWALSSTHGFWMLCSGCQLKHLGKETPNHGVLSLLGCLGGCRFMPGH